MADFIRGDIGDDGKQAAIGKDIQQVNIYADTITWRENIREKIADLTIDIRDLRSWARSLMIAILVIFVMGAILTWAMIRMFDMTNLRIDTNTRRLDTIERRDYRQYEPPPGLPLP